MSFIPQISDSELSELETQLVAYLRTPNDPTNDVIEHIIESGGKRLRPQLFLSCCDLLGYTGEHRHPIAAVCEYIHTASLLHDDVIDSSTLRRGKPTVSSVWGDETAVLAGDLIYSAACRLMVKTGSLELIDSFAECIRYMSESELFQLQLLWRLDTTSEHYLRVVDGKTAYLFAVSCQTPAFLARSPDLAPPLFEFGRSLGVAFQIMDDCLDYVQDEKTAGKPTTSDLFEGKVTLPLIFALQEADQQDQETVGKIARGELQRNQESEGMLRTIVKKHQGVERAIAYASQNAEKASQTLRDLRKMEAGSRLNEKVLSGLLDLPQRILGRHS